MDNTSHREQKGTRLMLFEHAQTVKMLTSKTKAATVIFCFKVLRRKVAGLKKRYKDMLRRAKESIVFLDIKNIRSSTFSETDEKKFAVCDTFEEHALFDYLCCSSNSRSNHQLKAYQCSRNFSIWKEMDESVHRIERVIYQICTKTIATICRTSWRSWYYIRSYYIEGNDWNPSQASWTWFGVHIQHLQNSIVFWITTTTNVCSQVRKREVETQKTWNLKTGSKPMYAQMR